MRMRNRRSLLTSALPIGLSALAAACGPFNRVQSLLEPDDREHLNVLADSSIAPTVPMLKRDFEQANPHVLLTIDLLPSGAITKRVLGGKDFDAVILGGDSFGVPIVEAGKIKVGTMRPIASNWLVIATAAEKPLEIQTPQDLLQDEVKRIGIADWEDAALGVYSRQSLENLGLWGSLEGKRAKSKDERELAGRLLDGKVDAALLYSSTSAASDERIKVQAPVPEQSHRPIIYYFGIAQETKFPITISQFSKYLVSQWGQRHFETFGFRMLNLR
jgi:molybdate transport system substrate-binding protein